MWDTRSQPAPVKDFKCRHAVNTVELHPKKPVLLSGDQGGNIRVWDLRMGRHIRELVRDQNSFFPLLASRRASLVSALSFSRCLGPWVTSLRRGNRSRRSLYEFERASRDHD